MTHHIHFTASPTGAVALDRWKVPSLPPPDIPIRFVIPSPSAYHELLCFQSFDTRGDSWITACFREIDRMQQLKPNWNGYGSLPPNRLASLAARDALEALWAAGHRPQRIAPLADDGLALWLTGPRATATLEFLNSGEITVEISRDREEEARFEISQSSTSLREALENLLDEIAAPAPADVDGIATAGSYLRAD